MRDENFKRVAALFREVRRLPPEQRRPHLSAACNGDSALYDEVLAMLSAHDASGGLTAAAHADLGTLWEAVRAGEAELETIGGFRLVRAIGSGGMGTVFEAVQDQPRRRVALKLLHPEFSTSQGLERFAREAEILGRFTHPAIAQIYAHGIETTPTGPRAYIAMEYVEGMPLDVWSRDSVRSIPERVHLLHALCLAVAHAHEAGVIHRDLKPGNVLVTTEGDVKVLDFGIARADDMETLHTHAGVILGTLAYMSPEQASGASRDADTRSDVYALGVLAYELLTGVRPYEVGDLSVAAAVHTVLEAEARPLRQHDRRLPSDLALIVGKAMEKERARRYGSATQMAEDLRRYLADKPIFARAPTATYQLRKFARRHKLLVTSSVVLLAALSLGLVVSLHFAGVAGEQAKRAIAEASLAHMRAADADLRENFPAGALKHLEAVAPAKRRWAWHHLRARCVQPTHSNALDFARGARPRLRADGKAAMSWVHYHPRVDVSLPDGSARTIFRNETEGAKLVAAWAGEHIVLWTGTAETGRIVLLDTEGAELASWPVRLAAIPGGIAAPISGAWVILGGRRAQDTGFLQRFDLRPTLRVHEELVLAGAGIDMVRADPAGTHVAASDTQNVVTIYRVTQGDISGSTRGLKRQATLRGAGSSVPSMALHGEAGVLIAASTDGTVRLWTGWAAPGALGESRPLPLMVNRAIPCAVAISPDGRRVAASDATGTISAYEAPTGALLATMGGTRATTSVILPGGKLLMTAHAKGIASWSLPGAPSVHQMQAARTGTGVVWNPRWTPDGQGVVVAGAAGSLGYFDVKAGRWLWQDAVGRGVRVPRMVFSADGDHVVYCASHLISRQTKTGTIRYRRKPEQEGVPYGAIARHPEVAGYLASQGGELRWHGEDLTPMELAKDLENRVEHAVFDPSGRYLLVRTRIRRRQPARLHLFSVAGRRIGASVRSLKGMTAVRFGRQPGSLEFIQSQRARAIDLDSGEDLLDLPLRPALYWIYTSDGREVAIGGLDGVIRIRDVESGQQLATLVGHTQRISGLAFRPDGTTLASTGKEGALRLWWATWNSAGSR